MLSGTADIQRKARRKKEVISEVQRLDDFYVLPLRLSPDILPDEAPIFHYCYLRQATDNDAGLADVERTLIIYGIPFDSTDAHFRVLFRSLGGRADTITFLPPPIRDSIGELKSEQDPTVGPVTSSQLALLQVPVPLQSPLNHYQIWDRELHPPGSSCVVRLIDKEALENVLSSVLRLKKLAKTRLDAYPIWGHNLSKYRIPELGLSRYQHHEELKIVPRDQMEKLVEEYMSNLQVMEQDHAEGLDRMQTEADDEGWITVTKSTSKRNREYNNIRDDDDNERTAGKKKGSSTGLKDFYRFQFREERREHANKLLQKFAEDKKRIEQVKKRRVFRPG